MKFTLLVGALALSLTALADAPKYEAGAFDIDAAHSKVGFEIPHMVISTVEGRFTKFDGKIVLGEKFDKSTVEATVDMTSIDTSNSKRDEHLKSPDFFDVAKFPKMTFKSKSISGTPDKFTVAGDLTIKGVTKPVTFDGKYLGLVNDGYGNDKAVFNAETKVKRSAFGLTWNKMVEAGPVVGDELKIVLRVEAAKPAKPGKPAKK